MLIDSCFNRIVHVELPGPYTPLKWPQNPHLTTIWGRAIRRPDPLPWLRKRLETPDNDFVDLINLPGAHEESPSFVFFHGLEGSLSSHYVPGMLQSANARGWDATMLFFRTCNGHVNRQARSYHSGETSDIDFVVRHLLDTRPRAPVVVVGFSLGGNALLKWLGEQGDQINPRVRAAAAVSVPYDLARSADQIEVALGGFYARRFVRTLKRKALAKLQLHPGIADALAVKRARTIREFDDAFTSRVHGFADAADYYARCSAIRYIEHITVPTLLLSAYDDPFMPPAMLDDVATVARNNPMLVPEFVPIGGHGGFLEGTSAWNATSYAERRPAEFAAAILGVSAIRPIS